MDLTDPDILMAWSHVMPAAQEVEGTADALGQMNNIDADMRQKAETAIHSMMPLLHETSQTCKVLPTVPSATLPLSPCYKGTGKRIDGSCGGEFSEGSGQAADRYGGIGAFVSKKIAV